jgi:putative colanic acid biosynthesis glycosyltransferase
MALERNKAPLFSIITVTYNCINTLQDTVISVLSQDCADYEYIIIDGGSTDGTLNIIKEYENRLSYWVSEKDKGIYHAMNKGIRVARGKFINFLNSGDLFSSHQALSIVKEEIEKLKEPADVIYGNIYLRKNDLLFEKQSDEPCNKHRMYFCHQSSFTKTDLLKKHGFNESYKMSGDLYFFKQCYYQNKIFHKIHKPLVIFDRGGISNVQRVAGLLENILVIKKLDKMPIKLIYYIKLYLVIIWCRLRNKK